MERPAHFHWKFTTIAVVVSAVVTLASMLHVTEAFAQIGPVERIKVPSDSLRGNLLGDAAVRKVYSAGPDGEYGNNDDIDSNRH